MFHTKIYSVNIYTDYMLRLDTVCGLIGSLNSYSNSDRYVSIRENISGCLIN